MNELFLSWIVLIYIGIRIIEAWGFATVDLSDAG